MKFKNDFFVIWCEEDKEMLIWPLENISTALLDVQIPQSQLVCYHNSYEKPETAFLCFLHARYKQHNVHVSWLLTYV